MRRRVMILLNSLAPYGAEQFVLNHVRFHDRARFELVVAHMGGNTELAPRFREANVELLDLSGGGPRYGPLTAARLVRALRDFDLLQTHIGLSGLVGPILGRLAWKPRIVVTEQTTLSSHPTWLQRATRVSYPLAHRHVYISQAVARDFARVFRDPDPLIITNGIDTTRIAEVASSARAAVRAELGLTSEDFAFANVGRLAEQKGQRYAISAMKAVRSAHPRASLWIMGAGPLEAALRAHAASESVADAVHFLGQRMDIHRLLGGFDAYVHPALFEGLGIAVLEAMAAGLPTIGASVDAIPEYVHHQATGLLVPPRDAAALAAAMQRLATNATERARLGAAGREIVRRDHDIRVAVKRYEALYDALLSAA